MAGVTVGGWLLAAASFFWLVTFHRRPDRSPWWYLLHGGITSSSDYAPSGAFTYRLMLLGGGMFVVGVLATW